MIAGITITLFRKLNTGQRDGLNRPVIEEDPVEVKNVLIQPVSEEEKRDILDMTGRRAVYKLMLPKGDTNEWTDCRVSFFNSDWRVIGDAMEWIEAMVPLAWNKQIRVERIDG